MAQSTVEQFANELKKDVVDLLEQFKAAGVRKKAGEDKVTEEDKAKLLEYLRELHGHKEEKKKITLTRKQTTEIKKADATGKARTIQVEVRKKRVFVKREATEPVEVEKQEVPVAAAPTIDADEMAKREGEARRQAELISRQAEEAKTKTKRVARGKKADEPVAAEAAAAPVEPGAEAVAASTAEALLLEARPLHRRRRGPRCPSLARRHPQKGPCIALLRSLATRMPRRLSRKPSSRHRVGQTTARSGVPSRRVATPLAVEMAGAARVAAHAMGTTMVRTHSARRPNPWCVRCWFRDHYGCRTRTEDGRQGR